MPDATCVRCGEVFSSRSNGGKPQRYCSKECYRLAAITRRALKAKRGVNVPFASGSCVVCGIECRRFNGVALCSDDCKSIRNAANQLAWQRAHPGLSYLRHKHKWRIYNARRRDRIEIQTIPGCCTEAKITARFAYFGWRCWMCGGEAQERDHVKPVSKGGLHIPANIRPICRSCNRSKKDRWPLVTSVRGATV